MLYKCTQAQGPFPGPTSKLEAEKVSIGGMP